MTLVWFICVLTIGIVKLNHRDTVESFPPRQYIVLTDAGKPVFTRYILLRNYVLTDFTNLFTAKPLLQSRLGRVGINNWDYTSSDLRLS